MDKRPISIESAEQDLAEAKALLEAEYHAVEAKVRRSASSPLLVGGVLLGAGAIGYLFAGKREKPDLSYRREKRGAWGQVLQIGQMLVPLLGALKAAQEAKAGRKAIAHATGTPVDEPPENTRRLQ
ncbi:MAG: hypothetical protein H0T80_01015 [Betaproteobacteria bacterium]|nr:hypothetical protein [Betaproteobacteria bacterium]